MRSLQTLKWLTVMGALLPTVAAGAAETPPLKTPQDMMNYSMGVEVVRNARKQDMELNLDLVIQGMRDAFAGKQLLLSEKEIRRSMNAVLAEVRQKQAQSRRVAAGRP